MKHTYIMSVVRLMSDSTPRMVRLKSDKKRKTVGHESEMNRSMSSAFFVLKNKVRGFDIEIFLYLCFF